MWMSPRKNAPGSAARSASVASNPRAPSASPDATRSDRSTRVGSISTGSASYFSHSSAETRTSSGKATTRSSTPCASQSAFTSRSRGSSDEGTRTSPALGIARSRSRSSSRRARSAINVGTIGSGRSRTSCSRNRTARRMSAAVTPMTRPSSTLAS